MAVLLEFRLFCRSEKPWNSGSNHFSTEKNPWSSVPNNFRMRKTLEFCSEPFSEEKKTSEFWSESFSEEKKIQNSVPNHFWKRQTLEFRFEPILRNRIHLKTIFLDRKHSKKNTFVSCFVKLNYFAEFRSILFLSELRNDCSETLGITRNKHCILRNNKNCSESIP